MAVERSEQGEHVPVYNFRGHLRQHQRHLFQSAADRVADRHGRQGRVLNAHPWHAEAKLCAHYHYTGHDDHLCHWNWRVFGQPTKILLQIELP